MVLLVSRCTRSQTRRAFNANKHHITGDYLYSQDRTQLPIGESWGSCPATGHTHQATGVTHGQVSRSCAITAIMADFNSTTSSIFSGHGNLLQIPTMQPEFRITGEEFRDSSSASNFSTLAPRCIALGLFSFAFLRKLALRNVGVF